MRKTGRSFRTLVVLTLLLGLSTLMPVVGAAQGGENGYVPYTESRYFDATTAGWAPTGIVLIDGIPLSIIASGEATCDAVDVINSYTANGGGRRAGQT